MCELVVAFVSEVLHKYNFWLLCRPSSFLHWNERVVREVNPSCENCGDVCGVYFTVVDYKPTGFATVDFPSCRFRIHYRKQCFSNSPIVLFSEFVVSFCRFVIFYQFDDPKRMRQSVFSQRLWLLFRSASSYRLWFNCKNVFLWGYINEKDLCFTVISHI